MNIRIMLCAAILPLAACADNADNVNAWYQQKKAECSSAPLTRANAVQQETCISAALAQANQARGSAMTTEADTMITAQHSAALEYASGAINREEFMARYDSAKAAYNLVVMQQQRQSDADRSQQTLQAIIYINQSVQPQQPLLANCASYRTGGVVQTNCY